MKTVEKEPLVKTWPHRYPVVLERDPVGGTYGGYALDLPVFTWGKASQEEALKSLSRGLALALLELEEAGKPIPEPSEGVPLETLSELHAPQVVFLEPAPVNPVSLELWRALKARGLSQRELARRMGTSPSAVHRLLDPFYFGHSLESLRRATKALGVGLEVRFAV
ncbi:antitoxin HicB [Thermus arciformis]|uniref:Antitoxin HicB n=1 Tax=Thermus arciformis TaxID=482827 RepID=A0A1G7HUI1_9DEIN|nr:antitoxin HicB [Thermus arciformis]